MLFVRAVFSLCLCAGSSLLGCSSGGQSLAISLCDHPANLTAAGGDTLFYLGVSSFSGSLSVGDLSIQTDRGSIVCAKPDGTLALRAGDILTCREGEANVFGPTDKGQSFNVSVRRQSGDTREEVTGSWTPGKVCAL